jgi:death-on-curing family protein
MRKITIQEVEYIAHDFAQKHLTFNEPIPDFSTRYPDKLESCIAMPFMKFNKKDLYPGILNKAAVLFYLLIKNHPFQNGNKRMAIMTTIVFLMKNKQTFSVKVDDLYRLTIWVANSPPITKDATIEGIKNAFENMISKRDS